MSSEAFYPRAGEIDDPYEFTFKMWGANSEDISYEVEFSRPPETIPLLVELLRTLATRIERGNIELPPVTRF